MLEEFEQVYSLMEEAFPPCEMRTYEGQKAVLKRPQYHLELRYDESGRVIAFLAWWQLSKACFVEHLAVSRQIRGGGVGGKLLDDFVGRHKEVVLEVEPAQTEVAARRIGFYKRHGFVLNEYPYMQPPMRKGEKGCPLLVMSSPKALSKEEFETVKEELYRTVYAFADNSETC